MKTEIKIKKGCSPEFPVNVQIWYNGFYCGNGKFCRNNEEAQAYINSLN